MKLGPKSPVTAAPLDFTGWPKARGPRAVRFIETYCVVPRGHGVGEPVRLRPFQKDIVKGALAPAIRQALVSIPRANGKTALAAMLALAELFAGPMSGEVLVVASDERQARIALRLAMRMIELSADLSERSQVFRDSILVPHTGATMTALPADPAALHGHDPSLLLLDELHVVPRAVWEACTSVAGKRPDSLTLAISTPSTSTDSVMFELVEHGRAGDDPAFYFIEYAAPDGCAVDDRAAWRIANPALRGPRPFLAEDGLASVLRTIREPVFRQLRLGQWVGVVDSWLPWGAWAACADVTRVVGDRERITLGFDGSASGDSTALIGCTVTNPHVFVLDIWQNPGDPRWRVPRAEVDAAVDAAFARYDVVEMACDPWGWRSEVEAWSARHGERRVIEWPTNVIGRMAPATDRLYAAVAEQTITHDGDPRLAAHISNCVAKATPQGDVIVKDKKSSTRKIDAAVAAIVAADRAAFHASNPIPERKVSFL